MARTDAARSLSYLGTAEAVDEIAHRFGKNPYWGGPGDPDSSLNSHWRAGLYGARDRAHVVARLERELVRTDRSVSPGFVSDLAVLELTRRFESRPMNAPPTITCSSYSTRHLAALKGAGSCEETWSTHSHSRPKRSRASALRTYARICRLPG